MHFNATDVYDYFKPSECVRRVALLARGETEQATDTAFVQLLRKLGSLHEKSHAAILADLVDLTSLARPDRERATLQAIRDGAAAIYQPRFRLELTVDRQTIELVGEPDFLIRDALRDGYKIRDSKLARNVSSPRHRGIPAQLQIYGFLYERLAGKRPTELEVHAGDGDIVAVSYAGEQAVLEILREHLAMRAADPAEYEPTGWTKCGGCGFEDRCRSEAEAAQDVALLSRVSQTRAREFHNLGIRSIADIARAVDDPSLREYFFIGVRKPRLKDFVAPLVRSAESWISKAPIRLDDAPDLPASCNVAMLDLEGLPPYADELDRTYLWGVKVFGDSPSAYLPAQAGFGSDGDREGWFTFLALANELFAVYGLDLPFVHWGSHEKTRIAEYIKRYGDAVPAPVVGAGLVPALSGIADRVLANLVDLLTVVRNSVVLPIPSYSLKVVEAFVGFRRTHTGDGAWSIARYIEATESNDPAARESIVREILAYNEEDLDATSAVLEWLRAFLPH